MTKNEITKIIVASLLLVGILNIRVTVAETTTDPIADGITKLKEIFLSLNTTDASMQANTNHYSPAHQVFNQPEKKHTKKHTGKSIKETQNVLGSYEE